MFETAWHYRRLAVQSTLRRVRLIAFPFMILSEVLAAVRGADRTRDACAAGIVGAVEWRDTGSQSGHVARDRDSDPLGDPPGGRRHALVPPFRLVWLIVLSPLELAVYRPDSLLGARARRIRFSAATSTGALRP